MSAAEPQTQGPTRSQRRRQHHKSRKGCFECKRRRVKCDELKLSCTRCKLGLRKCIYPPASLSPTAEREEFSLPTPSSSAPSLSPGVSSFLEHSTPFEKPRGSAPMFIERDQDSDVMEDFSQSPSDTALYHHYLMHTCRTLTYSQRDQGTYQIGMPTLALRYKTVLSSLLALSAACMCCDIISREPPPDIGAVTRILIAGYRHYNSASEGIRGLIERPDAVKAEPLLASAALLVPFTTAVQQVNCWISSRNKTHELNKLLPATPRDVIVMMRGMRMALQAMDVGAGNLDAEVPEETESIIDSSPLLDFGTQLAAPPPSQAHVMFPILAATNQGAFSKLRKRLKTAFASYSDSDYQQCPDSSLSACAAALETLDAIRINTFSPYKFCTAPSSDEETHPPMPPEPISLPPHVAPWLRSYATRHDIPKSNEPLTRPFLSFLVQAPQAYLDLVMPLLEQRLESPAQPLDDAAPGLTMVEALALDIYAHWSVIMILVEEESWWIGKLPVMTLRGMVNRYGDDFVSRLWPEHGSGRDDWWPESMLTISREIKRHSTT